MNSKKPKLRYSRKIAIGDKENYERRIKNNKKDANN